VDNLDREVESLEQDLEDGTISNEEFREQMRDIRDAQRGYAEEQAEHAYNDAMGW